MTDLESRLRVEIARRADGYAPRADLPARIRARVRRRRRQERVLRGGLAAGMATVAAVAGLLVTGSGGDPDGLQTAGPDTTTTTEAPVPSPSPPPSSPASSAGTAPPPTSGTSETAPTTTETSEPSPPPSVTGSSTTTSTEADLIPPDGATPAAGACGPAGGPVAEVVLAPDVPAPRCTQVRADQSLRVRNDSGQAVDVTFAGSSATLAPGESHEFPGPFGDHLQPGVHRVATSLYGGSGPEIWLAP